MTTTTQAQQLTPQECANILAAAYEDGIALWATRLDRQITPEGDYEAIWFSPSTEDDGVYCVRLADVPHAYELVLRTNPEAASGLFIDLADKVVQVAAFDMVMYS